MLHRFWRWVTGAARREARAAIEECRQLADELRRREEREAFLTAINAMRDVVAQGFEAQQASAAVMQEFLNQFKVTEPPKLRAFDEEDDARRYIDAKRQAMMAAQLDEFRAVLDHMEA